VSRVSAPVKAALDPEADWPMVVRASKERMMSEDLLTGLELRSTVTSSGELQLTLESVTIAAPGPDEIVVQVQAAPINPSDIALLLGPADLTGMRPGGTADRPTLAAPIPPQRMAMMKARLDESMPVGNEGAGLVVRAGANAQALLGKTVGMIGGGMYTQYRKLAAREVMPLPEGATAADGASMFVNPLTALAMVETMR